MVYCDMPVVAINFDSSIHVICFLYNISILYEATGGTDIQKCPDIIINYVFFSRVKYHLGEHVMVSRGSELVPNHVIGALLTFFVIGFLTILPFLFPCGIIHSCGCGDLRLIIFTVGSVLSRYSCIILSDLWLVDIGILFHRIPFFSTGKAYHLAYFLLCLPFPCPPRPYYGAKVVTFMPYPVTIKGRSWRKFTPQE